MDVGINPFYVNIEGVALTDYYARVIINPNGVVNLQEIMVEKKGETGKGTGEKALAQVGGEEDPSSREGIAPKHQDRESDLPGRNYQLLGLFHQAQCDGEYGRGRWKGLGTLLGRDDHGRR